MTTTTPTTPTVTLSLSAATAALVTAKAAATCGRQHVTRMKNVARQSGRADLLRAAEAKLPALERAEREALAALEAARVAAFKLEAAAKAASNAYKKALEQDQRIRAASAARIEAELRQRRAG